MRRRVVSPGCCFGEHPWRVKLRWWDAFPVVSSDVASFEWVYFQLIRKQRCLSWRKHKCPKIAASYNATTGTQMTNNVAIFPVIFSKRKCPTRERICQPEQKTTHALVSVILAHSFLKHRRKDNASLRAMTISSLSFASPVGGLIVSTIAMQDKTRPPRERDQIFLTIY